MSEGEGHGGRDEEGFGFRKERMVAAGNSLADKFHAIS